MSALNPPKPPAQPLERIEGHYRTFLARRWFGLAWRSALFSSLLFASTIFFMSGYDRSCIPLASLTGLLVFAFAVYPILWARRSFVTSPPSAVASPGIANSALAIISSARVLHLIVSYGICGLLYATAYCWVLDWIKPSSDLSLWASTARHPWHLNERFIFLVIGNGLLFTILGLRDVVADGMRPLWPSRRIPFTRAVKDALLESIPSPTTWNSLTVSQTFVAVYSLTYFVSRKSVWMLVATHFMGILRPFIVNFTKSSRVTITWSLVPHLAIIELVTLLILNAPVEALMAHVVQPLPFDTFTRKSPLSPDRYLLTALKSQNPYYLRFTLMELLRVSHNPKRRRIIFSDISKSPSLTLEIWQELLLILGRSHQTLISRNAVSRSPLPPAPSKPDSRSIPIKQGDIFKPVVRKKSTITMALRNVLDGPVRATPPVPVLEVEKAAEAFKGQALKQAGVVQSNVMGRIEGTGVGHMAIYSARGWKEGIYGWAGQVWAGGKVDAALPDVWLAERVIDIFATLAVASLEEDTYGHVQQVLPATLEAIVRFRTALLSFEGELVRQSSSLGLSQEASSNTARQRIGVPLQACEEAVRTIANAFGTSLSAFRFPPPIAQSLAEICRYHG